MKYISFKIKNYKVLTNEICISFRKLMIAPVIGSDKSGKSSVLQGIFAFDFRNDEYNYYQFKNIKNILSASSSENSIISAEITLKYRELSNIFFELLLKQYKKQVLLNLKKHGIDVNIHQEKELSDFLKKVKIYNNDAKSETQTTLVIKRFVFENTEKNFYDIDNFRNLNIAIQVSQKRFVQDISIDNLLNGISKKEVYNQLAKNIIDHLPGIVYFNDFNGSFIPKTICLDSSPVEKKENIWYSVFKNIFTINNINIERISDIDKQYSKNYFNKINQYLNHLINHYWERFGIGIKGDYKIDLTFDHHILSVHFIHTIDGVDFEVCQLPKTLNWYINFLFRLLFLFKVNPDNFIIYLFDEPGIYLPAYDQYKLCKNLSFLAKENHVVYTSQSHQLFNLEYIQLKSILLLSKNRDKAITLKYIRDSKSVKRVSENLMLQTIFEVLNLDNLDYFFAIDRPVLLVEGMADKFYLETFLNEKTLNKFFIVASQGASALIRNVQYLVAFNKSFIVLSDYDPAGMKGLELCKKQYQSYSHGAFIHLPEIKGDNSVVIEDMLSHETRSFIIKTLGLKKDVYKKSIIFTLVRSEDDKIKKVKENISQKTVYHFNLLVNQIEKELKYIS